MQIFTDRMVIFQGYAVGGEHPLDGFHFESVGSFPPTFNFSYWSIA